MHLIDGTFYALLNEINKQKTDELYTRMVKSFYKVSPVTRKNVAEYFNRFGFWGKLDPENGIYEEIELKAETLKAHIADFYKLYERLGDYRSKKTLYAILSNWYRYDFKSTTEAKEYMFDDYFDPDLVKCTPDEVVVDLGAYTGDTVLAYINNYGADCYKKIYCYEITKSVFEILKANTAGIRDIECRMKGVSDVCGEMRLNLSAGGSSANSLSDSGADVVETVSLDSDIAEAVTLIKADIEGGEQRALLGAARHISNEHPKLLISVYHSNDDLWKIPQIIDGISDDYRYYLRFKGSCIYPTEVTLFAL